MRFSRLFLTAAGVCVIAAFASAQDEPSVALRKSELRQYTALAAGASTLVLQSAKDYNVTWYGLSVRMLKGDASFSGTVRTALTSVVKGLTKVDFNAASSLTIDSVLLGKTRLTFTHSAEVLSISLPSALDSGSSVVCTTFYSSPYANSALTVTNVQNVDLGKPTVSIASQAEPYDARAWWPCKDDPSDKADSVEIIITTDSDLRPVCNGLQLSDADNGNSTHTVRWVSHYPIATYLISVAAANYSVKNYTFSRDGIDMPVGNWFYGLATAQMEQHATTMVDALGVLSDLFITYPFINEKYGMAEYEWGGSMEHQTVTSMGFYGQDVTVHELSHQWFGDKVTCATFEHIWLNEGWASYCEALYRERKGGLSALKAKMATSAFYGAGTIWVDNPESKPMGVIFSGDLTYNKASWVVHMLRGVVGDSAFFRATRKYLGDKARANYRPVTTDEYRGYYERESGMDLNRFFTEWIHGQYYPTYQFSWTPTQIGGNWTVSVDITQLYIPTRQIFDMPIQLRFSLGTRDTTVVVRDSTETAKFTFTFAERPAAATLDPDNWILKRVVQPLVNPTFDKGILLVNGVDWDVTAYTADIKQAYADSAFTGNRPYTFWDVFPNPAAGYPSNITDVKGEGAVPTDILGQYCTVVWVGNAYNGDELAWQNTSIEEYVKAGGNVLLITRLGRSFVTTNMLSQLGTTWTVGAQATIQNCVAEIPYLQDMTFTGDQSLVAPVSPALTRTENQLLFSETRSFSQKQAIGVLGKPVKTGEKSSGSLAYLAMRPYRVDRVALRANMQAILDQFTCATATDVGTPGMRPGTAALAQNYPNPLQPSSGASTLIPFTITGTRDASVVLEVFDALGRHVRTLVSGAVAPGAHTASFEAGSLPPGVYHYRLTVDGVRSARTMLVLR